jgi:putative hemolysin
VCRENLDEVIGITSVARLLKLQNQPQELLQTHVAPASFVPETLSGLEMLEQLRDKSGRLMFIVDEYGVVQGLMTPRDLLEAITGELKPGVLTDAWATPMNDGGWMLDGLMPISELKARLSIDQLPLEDKGRYNTVAGLLLAEFGQLPAVGDAIETSGWIFTVLEMEGRRIHRVVARRSESADVNSPISQPSGIGTDRK